MREGKPPTPKNETQPVLFKNGLVLSEVNLLKHPFNLLSNNRLDQLLEEAAKKKKSHIACEIELPDGGKKVWRVRPNVETGYTRPFDKKVLVTVLKLATDEGFPPPIVWKLGSLNRICRMMKIAKAGDNKRLVKESLLRISATNIYAETFWLKDEKRYWQEKPESVGGSFTLWSVFWRGDRLPNGQAADNIYLAFNAPFIWSLQAYYVSPLDYDYWLSLTPLAQRLYELSGRKFYGLKHSEYTHYKYLDLCQLLPIMPQKKFSDAKRILDRAHQALKKTGWLKEVRWEGIRRRTRFIPNKPWVIRYYPGVRAREELAQSKERLERFQSWENRQLVSTDQERLTEIRYLVKEIEQATGDNHSRKAFTKIAKNLPSQVLWRLLSEVKVDYIRGPLEVKRSPAAIFMDKVKRYCAERQLDIGIKFKGVG